MTPAATGSSSCRARYAISWRFHSGIGDCAPLPNLCSVEKLVGKMMPNGRLYQSAPIHIAMVTRKALMQTIDMTSWNSSVICRSCF